MTDVVRWPEFVAAHPELKVKRTATHHAAPVEHSLLVKSVLRFARLVRRHLFGIVVITVALALTGGCVVGFLGDREPFPAVLSALIGGLGIAVGVIYHSLGEAKR